MTDAGHAVPGPGEKPPRREAPGKPGQARSCPGREREAAVFGPGRGTQPNKR